MERSLNAEQRLKCELEDLKKQLTNGSTSDVNLDQILGELDRITNIIETIENENESKSRARTKSISKPKAMPISMLVSESVSTSTSADGQDFGSDESILKFWMGVHQQLPECGFPIPFAIHRERKCPFTADVHIICREGSIKVHRVVLIAASEFFRDEFKKIDEDNPVVHLLDWSVKEVKPVFDLLYRGQVLLPANYTASIWQLLYSLRIHNPQIKLNLSPATTQDFTKDPDEFSSNFTEKKSPQTFVKFSTPRTLFPDKFPPAAVLHEFFPSLEFLYENRVGLGREPGFVVKMHFEATNKTYSVRDSCKRTAKHKCALLILNDLGIPVKYQTQNQHQNQNQNPNLNQNQNPTPNPSLNPTPVIREVSIRNSRSRPKRGGVKHRKPAAPQRNVNIVSRSFQNVDLEKDVVQRIVNIKNLEENAWAALSNLNGSDPTPFEFPARRCPPYLSTYTCRVLFNNSWFSGTDVSQKGAKAKAALEALVSILGPEKLGFLCERSKHVKNEPKSVPARPAPAVDSNQSQIQNPVPSSSSPSISPPSNFDCDLEGVDKEIFERIKGIPNLDKNCYIAINSLNNSDTPPEYEYRIQEDPNPNPNPDPNSDESLNPSGRHKFICILKIMGQEFFGEGDSKTKAKENVGRETLIAILGEKTYEILLERSKTLQRKTRPKPKVVQILQASKPSGAFKSNASASFMPAKKTQSGNDDGCAQT